MPHAVSNQKRRGDPEIKVTKTSDATSEMKVNHQGGSVKFKTIVVLVISSLTVACLNATDRLRKEFEVGAAPRLIVDVDAANIIVERGTSGKIVAHVSLPNKDRFKLTSDQEGDVVRISLENRGVVSWLSAPFDFASGEGPEVLLEVPGNCSLMLNAGAGSIRIEELESSIKARTGAGAIFAEAVSGDAELFSGSGSIRVDDFTGKLDASSDAGSIHVEDSDGEFYLGNGVGEVNVYNCSGKFRITTSIGAINFAGAVTDGNDNLIRTDIGTIDATLYEVEDIEIDAASDLGSVTVTPLPPIMVHEEHSFEYTIGTGEIELKLRSRMGDIRITRGLGELPIDDGWEEVDDDENDTEDSDGGKPTEK